MDQMVQASVGNQGYAAASPGAEVVLYATVRAPATEGLADASSDAGDAPAKSGEPTEVALGTWTLDAAIEPGTLSAVHTFEVPLTTLAQALGMGEEGDDPGAGELLALHATVTAAPSDTEYHTDNNDTAWGLAPCTLP